MKKYYFELTYFIAGIPDVRSFFESFECDADAMLMARRYLRFFRPGASRGRIVVSCVDNHFRHVVSYSL